MCAGGVGGGGEFQGINNKKNIIFRLLQTVFRGISEGFRHFKLWFRGAGGGGKEWGV